MGRVLRSLDGGKHWQVIKVPDAGELDSVMSMGSMPTAQ